MAEAVCTALTHMGLPQPAAAYAMDTMQLDTLEAWCNFHVDDDLDGLAKNLRSLGGTVQQDGHPVRHPSFAVSIKAISNIRVMLLALKHHQHIQQAVMPANITYGLRSWFTNEQYNGNEPPILWPPPGFQYHPQHHPYTYPESLQKTDNDQMRWIFPWPNQHWLGQNHTRLLPTNEPWQLTKQYGVGGTTHPVYLENFLCLLANMQWPTTWYRTQPNTDTQYWSTNPKCISWR